MAKDDYFVIISKILVYLYKRLKGQDKRAPMEYLNPNTKDFPISPEYFNYCIKHMYTSGFIEGVTVQTVNGEPYAVTEDIQITPEGISFMQDNSKIRKALKLLPEAAGLIETFI